MLADLVISIINLIIDSLASVANAAISILPESPFLFLTELEMESNLVNYISYFNWVVPVTSFLTITIYWLSAIVIYYLVSVILRWVKLIQ